MAQKRRASIQTVRYVPAEAYQLDLEVFSVAELRRRMADEYLGLTQRIDFHMLICVTEGSFTHTVDFEPVACRPGSLMTLRPAQVQQFDVTTQWAGWLVIFRPEFLLALGSLALADDVKVHGSLDSLPTHLQLSRDELRAALACIVQMDRDAAMGAASAELHALLRHQLYALLLRLHLGHRRQAASGAASVLSLQRFKRFQQLLETRFSIQHQVAAYAKQLGCSEKSLTRASMDGAGVKAKAYIDARINLEAKRLLSQTALPIARIGDQIGFDEATNFVKFFKREVGCAPGAFRRQHAR